MSTFDATKPLTTDNYSTVFVPTLQGNFASLAYLLDPTQVSAYGTLSAGMKRFNGGNGLFESWSGSAWAATPTGYVVTTGSIMSGALIMNNAVSVSWKDGGGTPRRGALLSSANFYFGDIDNTVASSNTLIRANNAIEFDVNAVAILNITGSSVASNKLIVSTPGAGECFRATNDNAFLSFYNTAASTRTGYMQGSTGSALTLMAENGNFLQLGTNGGARMTISPGGNVGINQSPSAWGSTFRGLEMQAVGNGLMASASTLYIVNNVYFNGTNWILGQTAGAGIYLQSGGSHSWYTMASGTAGSVTTPVSAVNIDVNGNFMVGTGTPTSNAAGRGLIEVNGSSNALIALDVGGTRKAYVHYTGSQLNVVSESGSGPLALYGNGINGLTLGTLGQVNMMGASTATVDLGSGGGAITANCSLSNVFKLTLTSNLTSLTLSNMADGQTINLQITQDATGSRTTSASLTNANGFRWPGGTQGVLSTAANSVDLLVLTKVGSVVLTTLTKGFA